MEWTGILAITGHASIFFNLYKLASMPIKRLWFSGRCKSSTGMFASAVPLTVDGTERQMTMKAGFIIQTNDVFDG